MTHKLLQSALRGKAPIVAIPIEGHSPFCINRVLLAKWAKGVEIIGVEVGENRWLHIHGQVKREQKCAWGTRHYVIKTRCSLPAISRSHALGVIWKWGEKERKARARVIAQGATNTKEFRAAEKAAKLKAIEVDQPEVRELEGARRALWSVRCEIARRVNPPKPIRDRWDQANDDRLRERFLAWREGKKARGIQGKRERERRPEMMAIDAEYARIVPPHRGKGSRRVMSQNERLRAAELRRQLEAIRSYIEFEAGWDDEQHYYGNPAKAAREPRKVYGEPTPRVELAKELVAAKRRLAEAERMMQLFEVERAAMEVEG